MSTNKVILKPLFHKKVDPLTLILKDIFKDNRNAMSYLGALSIGLGFSQVESIAAEDDVEEVVVTASKRESNIQDLPMAVQAITSEELEAKNISDFNDIANLVPSITVDDSGSGNSYFYIRGVSDGGFGNRAGAQASTALYIDEQPLSTIGGNPDLHVYDIERVEILTGPQGTLYGSSSQAGTVKIITKKPNPEEVDLGFDLEYGDVHDGSPDRSLETFVNIPLGFIDDAMDSAALRVSFYDLHSGGYLDNVATTQNFTYLGTHSNADYIELRDDYNFSDKKGHRVRFSNEFDNGLNLDISFLRQEYLSNGSWESDVAEGARKVSRYTPETFEDNFEQVSLTLSGPLTESIDFTLTSSMFERDIAYTYDYTQYVAYTGYDLYAAYYYDYDYYASTDPRVFYTQFDKYDRVSNEFRIQSVTDSGYQWILGMFRETNEQSYQTFYDFTGDLTNSSWVSVDDRWWGQDNIRDDEQKAIFGEVTVPVNEKTDLTVGFRKYETENDFFAQDGYFGNYETTDTGYFEWIGRTNLYQFGDDGVAPKFNIAHRPNDNLLVYGTYSEGFRPSGINRTTGRTAELVPDTYNSDLLRNLEFGWKSTLADGKVTFNGLIYHMNWEDYQSTRYVYNLLTVAYVDNVGMATVSGGEMAGYFNISDTFSMSLMANINDPTMDDDLVDAGGTTLGNKGNTLAYVPEHRFILTLDKDFNVKGKPAYMSLDSSYTGKRWADELNTTPMPSYSIMNIRAGMDLGKGISGEIFINNANDTRPVLGLYDDFGDLRQTSSQPRVIGLRLRYKY
tara:strand:+ start:526 stop:2898 length:2373 start_codon:yes stop_codon:yes gene_type:complete